MTLARSRPGDRERLKADGLFAEIIGGKWRLFAPVERSPAKDAAS
jgi:hypothetical protein